MNFEQTTVAFKAIEGIPLHKRRRKALQTVFGWGIFVGAWFLPILTFPWYVATIVAFFGGMVASKELTLKYIGVAKAVIVDILGAWKK